LTAHWLASLFGLGSGYGFIFRDLMDIACSQGQQITELNEQFLLTPLDR
jgi:hypothetical protein